MRLYSFFAIIALFVLPIYMLNAEDGVQELFESTETPVFVNGERYMRIEIGNENFLVQMLSPDGSDRQSMKCKREDAAEGGRIPLALVTGQVRITQRSRAFVEALHESCRDGRSVVTPNLGRLGVVFHPNKRRPEIERKIYTTPALNTLGFETNW